MTPIFFVLYKGCKTIKNKKAHLERNNKNVPEMTRYSPPEGIKFGGKWKNRGRYSALETPNIWMKEPRHLVTEVIEKKRRKKGWEWTSFVQQGRERDRHPISTIFSTTVTTTAEDGKGSNTAVECDRLMTIQLGELTRRTVLDSTLCWRQIIFWLFSEEKMIHIWKSRLSSYNHDWLSETSSNFCSYLSVNCADPFEVHTCSFLYRMELVLNLFRSCCHPMVLLHLVSSL